MVAGPAGDGAAASGPPARPRRVVRHRPLHLHALLGASGFGVGQERLGPHVKSQYAQQVAELFGPDHHVHTVTPEAIPILENLWREHQGGLRNWAAALSVVMMFKFCDNRFVCTALSETRPASDSSSHG